MYCDAWHFYVVTTKHKAVTRVVKWMREEEINTVPQSVNREHLTVGTKYKNINLLWRSKKSLLLCCKMNNQTTRLKNTGRLLHIFTSTQLVQYILNSSVALSKSSAGFLSKKLILYTNSRTFSLVQCCVF